MVIGKKRDRPLQLTVNVPVAVDENFIAQLLSDIAELLRDIAQLLWEYPEGERNEAGK